MVQDLYVISVAAKWWNFIKITVFWDATPCSMAKEAPSLTLVLFWHTLKASYPKRQSYFLL